MSAIPVVEVAIALALLYLFFSQVVTSVFEIYATAVNRRGNYLRGYLNQALNSGSDKNWAELVYRHPSVDMLAQKTSRSPAYVPSSVFVKAIVDLVIDEVRQHTFVAAAAGAAAAPPTAPQAEDYVYKVIEPVGTPLANFEAGLAKVREGDFKVLMRTLLLNARGCTACQGPDADEEVFAEFVHGLAVWYDGYMERVSGWYKRDIRPGLFWVGLLVAVFCNLDSLRVASYLWSHSAERQRIVAYAATQADDSNSVRRMLRSTSQDNLGLSRAIRQYTGRIDSLTNALQALGFPIGWSLASESVPNDSSHLPNEFLIFVPAATVRLPAPAEPFRLVAAPTAATAQPVAPPAAAGPVLAWRQPAHYLRYQRRIESTLHRGLLLRRTFWTRTVVSRATAAQQAHLIRQPPPGAGWWTRMRSWLRHLARQITPLTLLGWLLTAAALSVGAPFWFEVLNRFINVRNLGVRPPTATPTPAKEPR